MENAIRITVDLYYKVKEHQLMYLDTTYDTCLKSKDLITEQLRSGSGADLVDIIEIEKVEK